TIDGGGVFAVVPDDRRGSATAVAHLAGLGHTRIGHIAGPQSTTTGLLRYRGFVEAMGDAGLGVGAEQVAHGETFTIAGGARAAGLLLERIEDPEATPQTLMFEPTLIVRESTAAPSRKPRRGRGRAGSGGTAARGSREAGPTR